MNINGKNIKSKFTNLSKKNIYSDSTLIKNCGFSPYFFDEMNDSTYVFEKNSNKEVSSASTVVAIPINKNSKNPKKNYDKKEKETYEKMIKNNIKNDILKNFSETDYKTNDESNNYDPQIHFRYLISNINDDESKSPQIIEAYKSKHKSKFIKIYESNSINFNENNKYKLFHKCCYPGCNRTFSSSGWLKAHFKDHLKQIHNCLFCKLFQRIILNDQVELMNHSNNNFLGLEDTNKGNNK